MNEETNTSPAEEAEGTVHSEDVDEAVTVVSPDVTYVDEEPSPAASDSPDAPADDQKDEVKSVEDVAKEVVEGKWGVGQERRIALDNAGFNVQEVEEAVKQLLNP